MSIDDLTQAVYCAMKPGVWYRPADIAQAIGIETEQARYAMKRLVNGGLVEKDGDKNRLVFMSHQSELPLVGDAHPAR